MGTAECGNPTESAGMGMNVAEYQRDGSNNCGIPAGMDYIITGIMREWSASPCGILKRPFYLRVCDFCGCL